MQPTGFGLAQPSLILDLKVEGVAGSVYVSYLTFGREVDGVFIQLTVENPDLGARLNSRETPSAFVKVSCGELLESIEH
jgi:hypothetical protein